MTNDKPKQTCLELDFQVIDAPLQKLRTQIAYLLEITPPARRVKGLEVVRIHLGLAYAGYQATKYLCAESPPDPIRKLEFIMVAPSIQRSMLDGIFNLAYFSTDFKTRMDEYFRGTWREAHERLERYVSAYGTLEEWQGYLKNNQDYVSMIEAEEKITSEEKRRPKNVSYWPTPSQMLKKSLPSGIKNFFQYLDAWFYRSYSQQDHLSGFGLAKKGAIFLLGSEHPQIRDSVGLVRSETVYRGFLLLLMTMSEINAQWGLGKNVDLQYAWTLLGGYFGETKELYDLRYQQLLKI